MGLMKMLVSNIAYQTVEIEESATIENAFYGSHSEEWKLAAS